MSKIAVVIPCYRCSQAILRVLSAIPASVERVFVVDDACPESTGALVERECKDKRVRVIHHTVNKGVGGAVISGYRAALNDGFDIVVKVDGDGQMDPANIANLIHPILRGKADYTKGNRFFSMHQLKGMPSLRVIGNSFLSFMTKVSSGYWNVMDPTNGFTAIHRTALKTLNLDAVSERFFFESDMLCHLNLTGAVVMDVPFPSKYDGEKSNLKIHRIWFPFLRKHVVRTIKRFFYSYFVRDFNIGTVEFTFGSFFLGFGTIFGGYHWIESGMSGKVATSGTVMLSGMSVILGIQLLLAAVIYDVTRVPKVPLQDIIE
jgi:glycosyltransferase involved in cell wall biosynthesis